MTEALDLFEPPEPPLPPGTEAVVVETLAKDPTKSLTARQRKGIEARGASCRHCGAQFLPKKIDIVIDSWLRHLVFDCPSKPEGAEDPVVIDGIPVEGLRLLRNFVDDAMGLVTASRIIAIDDASKNP